MFTASPSQIRHREIYYDTAHEAICLEALRRVGVHASKATPGSDTITDRDGRPYWEPDLRIAVPQWMSMPAGSPVTGYVECKEWRRNFGDPVPVEVADKLRQTAAFGVFPLVVLTRHPIVYNGFAWWGWVCKPSRLPVWEELIFPSLAIMDAYAEASQVVAPAQRWRRWEAREQLKLPLRRREAGRPNQRIRRPSLP